jgi:hypothetical protein
MSYVKTAPGTSSVWVVGSVIVHLLKAVIAVWLLRRNRTAELIGRRAQRVDRRGREDPFDASARTPSPESRAPAWNGVGNVLDVESCVSVTFVQDSCEPFT